MRFIDSSLGNAFRRALLTPLTAMGDVIVVVVVVAVVAGVIFAYGYVGNNTCCRP